MRLLVIIFAWLCLLQRVLMGVQPMPNGTLIAWDRPTQAGWSNYTFNIWRQVPPVTNWAFLGSTVSNAFFVSNAVLAGTMFGVSSTAQSNAVFATGDLGVAAAPPDVNAPGYVVLTLASPWLVPTGLYLKASQRLGNSNEWVARQKFGISGSNVLVWHQEGNTNRHLFFSLPVVQMPPMP